MDSFLRATIIIAQSTAAMAEIEAMKAANAATPPNKPMPYTAAHFRNVVTEYNIGYNQVIAALRD